MKKDFMALRRCAFIKSTGLLLSFALLVTACANTNGADRTAGTIELLNVSYDPTRELWRDINLNFISRYEKETGNKISIKQSHGGSSTQARAVIDGLEADVVTIASIIDIDAIRQKGLINDGWVDRLPQRSLPYYSTIVFVVRKGDPHGSKDCAAL